MPFIHVLCTIKTRIKNIVINFARIFFIKCHIITSIIILLNKNIVAADVIISRLDIHNLINNINIMCPHVVVKYRNIFFF